MAVGIASAMKFADKLNAEIARRGTSQSALARETGIDQSAISAMTRGSRRPYMDQALLLARSLGVSLDYLADDTLDRPPVTMPDLTYDERVILDIFKELRLPLGDAMRRLVGPTPPPQYAEGGPRAAEPPRTQSPGNGGRPNHGGAA